MTQMNLSMKQIQTHKPRKQSCGCQEGGGGKNWDLGISRCKPSYIRWINNKVLLCNTGDYIQYPVINHTGRECEKEYMDN